MTENANLEEPEHRARRMNQEYSGKEFPASDTGKYSIYDYLDDIIGIDTDDGLDTT